jgi:hypothetical protein
MPSSVSRARARPDRARASLAYRSQRVYVVAMLDVLGRLLVAGSAVDPTIQRELASFPEGLTIGFAVLGESLQMRVAYRKQRLVLSSASECKPDIEIVFKHISHAFALLSFQESTPVAFSNDRMVTHGDVGHTMRFVRCLDRVQGVMLPDPIALRALKSLPAIPLGERLLLATRITGRLLRTFVIRREP